MKYKKMFLSLSLCGSLLLVACQKNDQKVSANESGQKQDVTQHNVAQKKDNKALMLEAIKKSNKELLGGTCKIVSDVDDDSLIIGDLNHDSKADFLYGYAKVWECDAQVPAYEYAVFLQNKDGSYRLASIFAAGMQDHLDRVEFNRIENNIIKGVIPYSEEKVQYIYKNKSLEEIEDPNNKTIIQLGKQMYSNSSPFFGELDRMSYVADEVECGGFFPDDQAEKSTTIDHYDLRIANDQMVVMGVFGLTAKDQVQVMGKTVTSATTLSQVKQLFKTGYSLDESKNSTDTIGAASEDAAKLKYDVMLSINTKDMDDAYLFYFKNNQLIAVKYFIPC